MDGKNGALTEKEMAAAIDYIKKDKTIREVILSGGDPLFLDDKTLSEILKKLRAISHIKLLESTRGSRSRFHRASQKNYVPHFSSAEPLWIVIHINHPKEITPQFRKAVAKFQSGRHSPSLPIGFAPRRERQF